MNHPIQVKQKRYDFDLCLKYVHALSSLIVEGITYNCLFKYNPRSH